MSVNQNILKWARNRREYTPEFVASKLNVDSSLIEEWECGESVPTYSKLEKLAYELYKVPLACFFAPKVPHDVDPEAKFRMLLSGVVNKPKMYDLIHEAACYQIYLEEINEGSSRWVYQRKSISLGTDESTAERTVRELLRVNIQQQIDQRNEDEYFEFLRLTLARAGIFVFKNAFKNDEISGFCLTDEKYPVIMINNSSTVTRQIFTIIHELVHILLNSKGVTKWSSRIGELTDNEYKEELYCNKVASEFLVPRRMLLELVTRDDGITEETFRRASSIFNISREVVARICLEYSLITQISYETLREKWNSQIKKNKKNGGNYYYTKKTYLGLPYVNAVFEGYHQNRWTKRTASEYLGIRISNFEKFSSKVLGV